MIYNASPASDHGYAYMSNAEATLNFLQNSDAFVVKGYLGSKAKPCCPEKLLFHVPRRNHGYSYQQKKLPILTMWALEATLGDLFSGLDKTTLGTSRM